MLLAPYYPIAYETVKSPRIEYEYYDDERQTSRDRNINNNYASCMLTLESPINLNRSLLASLIQIRDLQDNWDGYNAVKPSNVAYNRAKTFLEEVPNSFIESLGSDNIFPNPNGTISIEWENASNDTALLEIGDNNATFYSKLSNGQIYINNNVDINDGGINPEVFEAIHRIIASI